MLQQRIQHPHGVRERYSWHRAIRQGPIRFTAHRAVAPFEPSPRLKFFDALDQRPRIRNVIERKVAIQSGERKPSLDFRMHEDRFQLRSKIEIVAAPRDVQRLDSGAVARQHQALGFLAPQRYRKHSAQPRKAFRVPLDECAQHRLSIRVAAEAMPARFQFAAQFEVIVDFAVERDHVRGVFADDRLIAAVQVDNFQAGGAQRDHRGLKDALLVRSTVDQAIHRAVDAVRIRYVFLVGETGDAAQNSLPRALKIG